jgi:hypothetical protein
MTKITSLEKRQFIYVLEGIKQGLSGEASPTIWSCYANISVLIDLENNQFLKKLIIII